jgi:hypothetical protein
MIRTLSVILMGGLFFETVASTYAGPFTRREARQQARINQGIRTAEVTPREFRYLERKQASIEAHRRMAWSDGRLSPWEARHLTKEQDRVSHDIWRVKHNAFNAW